jgi:hypothetical protein
MLRSRQRHYITRPPPNAVVRLDKRLTQRVNPAMPAIKLEWHAGITPRPTRKLGVELRKSIQREHVSLKVMSHEQSLRLRLSIRFELHDGFKSFPIATATHRPRSARLPAERSSSASNSPRHPGEIDAAAAPRRSHMANRVTEPSGAPTYTKHT